MGQPANLADPYVFHPVDSSGLMPNQPVDLGAEAVAQPGDLFIQVAKDLGMPLDTITSGQATWGMGQTSLTGNI